MINPSVFFPSISSKASKWQRSCASGVCFFLGGGGGENEKSRKKKEKKRNPNLIKIQLMTQLPQNQRRLQIQSLIIPSAMRQKSNTNRVNQSQSLLINHLPNQFLKYSQNCSNFVFVQDGKSNSLLTFCFSGGMSFDGSGVEAVESAT